MKMWKSPTKVLRKIVLSFLVSLVLKYHKASRRKHMRSVDPASPFTVLYRFGRIWVLTYSDPHKCQQVLDISSFRK